MLTLIAAPFLVLFGTGLVTDDEIALSTRLIMVPIYNSAYAWHQSSCGGA